MKKIFIAAFLLFISSLTVFAQKPVIIKTGEGVIVYPYQPREGSVKAVRLKVFADGIIRVTINRRPYPALLQPHW